MDSHIIPEFLFQKLYDNLHRFRCLSSAPKVKNGWLQKGLREPLLGRDCEQRLSDWEQYASQVLSKVSLEVPTDGSKIYITNLDYAKFKLFQLSILWRAGVSRRREFRQVHLGPHQERLRGMLLAVEPGTCQDDPSFMRMLLNEGQPIDDLIVAPPWASYNGHKCYRFVFGRIAWIQLLSRHNLDSDIHDSCLKEDGSCVIGLLDWQEMGYLKDMAQELAVRGKLDDQ